MSYFNVSQSIFFYRESKDKLKILYIYQKYDPSVPTFLQLFFFST